MFDSLAPKLPMIDRDHDIHQAVQLLAQHGVLVVTNAADASSLAETAAQLAPWFEQAFEGTGPFFGRATKRFSGVFAKAPATAALACEPFVLSIVEATLKGSDLAPRCDAIQLNLTQAIGILPGERAQVLHRDEVMFPFAHDYEIMVNVMWALDPWRESNGATRFAPGSMAWPRTRLAQSHEVVAAHAPAGAAIIWLGSTIHGGGANRSERIRRGLAFSYSLGWLAQSERLLLSTPPHVARTLPERVQRLIGYQLQRPNLGWVEERDPIDWLHGIVGDLAPADDNLTPAQEALIRWQMAEAAA